MAEYMDYNEYNYDFKSKKEKIRANIRLIIAIVFLVATVIFVIVKLPNNTRTKFGPVYSKSHSIGEQKSSERNEFYEFYKTYKDNDTINFNDEFEAKYPKTFSLLRTSKLDLTKDKVYSYDIGGYFVIAKPYEVSRDKDSNGNYYDEEKEYIVGVTGVDFYIFKYDTKNAFTVFMPERFTLYLHSGNSDLVPFVQRTYVKSSSFKLNYYSLSITVSSEKEFENISATLNLKEGINKSEFENKFFTKKMFVKSKSNQDIINSVEKFSGGRRGDKFIINKYDLSTPVKNAEVGTEFDDTFYAKFKSLQVESKANSTYKIKVN